MPGTAVPYRWITGLPPQAQKEIERDFLHVQQQLGGSALSMYDALIDGSLTTSDASTHRYKNLGDFVTMDSRSTALSGAIDGVIRIGVLSSFTETADVTVYRSSIVLESMVYPEQHATGGITPNWDIAGHTVQIDAGDGGLTYTAVLRGLFLKNSGGSKTNFIAGVSNSPTVLLDGCLCAGTLLGNGAYTQITAGLLFANETTFDTKQLANATFWLDCHYIMGTTSNYTLTTHEFHWVGGSWTNSASNTPTTITIGGTSAPIHIDDVTVIASTFLAGTASGGRNTISVGTTGAETYIRMLSTGSPTLDITVPTAAGPTVIEGDWRTVTFSSNTTPDTRRFSGTTTLGGTFNGPMTADITLVAGFAGNVTIGGVGVLARIGGNPGASPVVSFVSATDAVVMCAVKPGAVNKPYAIDSGSSRCILIMTTTSGSWVTAGTNAGTNCRVINELGDSFGGLGGGGDPHKDLVPSLLLDGGNAAAPVVFPPVTGSAPTGAAGGSLAGTYPNPTFAGRDASVDELNKDMTQAFLMMGG